MIRSAARSGHLRRLPQPGHARAARTHRRGARVHPLPRRVRRAPTSRRADLRIIAATNRPERDLKHDVLARLEIRLTLPSLDARADGERGVAIAK